MPEEIRCWADLKTENDHLHAMVDAAAETIEALTSCVGVYWPEREKAAMEKHRKWSDLRKADERRRVG